MLCDGNYEITEHLRRKMPSVFTPLIGQEKKTPVNPGFFFVTRQLGVCSFRWQKSSGCL